MPNVIWSIAVSLDGFIADANGRFEWAAPDPELHQVHNDQTRELSAHLIGRRRLSVHRTGSTGRREDQQPDRRNQNA